LIKKYLVIEEVNLGEHSKNPYHINVKKGVECTKIEQKVKINTWAYAFMSILRIEHGRR